MLRLVSWDPEDAGENPENETGPKRTSSKIIIKKYDVKVIEIRDIVEAEQLKFKHAKTIKYAALKLRRALTPGKIPFCSRSFSP